MSDRIELSALVVCQNEENRLADCLAGLRFADEIVVVLDRSTDRSKEIALGFTDRILEGAWPIEGDRRNAGLDFCRGAWILEVDADERVTPALAEEIRAAIAAADYGYFLIPFDNYIGDRLVRHGWGAAFGVSSAPRLHAKGAKRWGRERVHPKLTLSGAKGRLKTPIRHEVDRNISDMLRRLDRYSTARAADLRESGDIGSLSASIRRIFTRFWKCFVSRKGYREGAWGFLIALLAGLYPILSHLKARLEKGE
jgi:glycosyltransferase involved in cell wall biosynthesis